MNQEAISKFKKGKTVALRMGGAVYVGVVLLFVSFYESLMGARFEGVLGVIARIGAFLVAGNALALPVALHFWTVTKAHKIAASIFYGCDIIIMAMNVIASASTGDNIPPWVTSWQIYSPASIIFVIAGWAVLFMIDPGQRALVDLMESFTMAQVAIVQGVLEHIKSEEGVETLIKPAAAKMVSRFMNMKNLIGEHQSLNEQKDATATGGDNVEEDLTDQITALLEKAGGNGNSRQMAEALLAGLNPTPASTSK